MQAPNGIRKQSASLRTLLPGLLLGGLALSLVALQGCGNEEAAPEQQAQEQQPDMALVTPSPMDFEETVEAFRDEVDEAGWSILNRNDMHEVLAERGFDVAPVAILDVCSGQYSAQVLEEDEFRPVSAFMPCRVSIYEDSNGNVSIARMNVPAFLPMLPPGVAEVMEQSSNEIEAIIEQTIAR